MTLDTRLTTPPDQAARHIPARIAHLPPELQAVALVDIRTAVAVGGMSESHWRDLVREGVAPQPAVQSPKFTRWRLSDIVEFWRTYQQPPGVSERLRGNMREASARALAKRRGARP